MLLTLCLLFLSGPWDNRGKFHQLLWMWTALSWGRKNQHWKIARQSRAWSSRHHCTDGHRGNGVGDYLWCCHSLKVVRSGGRGGDLQVQLPCSWPSLQDKHSRCPTRNLQSSPFLSGYHRFAKRSVLFSLVNITWVACLLACSRDPSLMPSNSPESSEASA